VAVLTGLCIGAIAVYTPEEGITLAHLQADIDHLKRSFALDRGENRMGKIFLRNEKASEKAYTTEMNSKLVLLCLATFNKEVSPLCHVAYNRISFSYGSCAGNEVCREMLSVARESRDP